MPSSIIFATHNLNKVAEFKALLASVSLEKLSDEVLSLHSFPNFPEVDENFLTLEGNAMKKCREVYKFLFPKYDEFIVLSDDTGLEIEAINGEPGVYSARYASLDGKKSHDSEANIQKVLKKLKKCFNRRAKFRTVIGITGKTLTEKGREMHGHFESYVEGLVQGTIGYQKKGNFGFGYDSIFIPDNGNNKSFAEMNLQEKNLFSHRSRAFNKALTLISILLDG